MVYDGYDGERNTQVVRRKAASRILLEDLSTNTSAAGTKARRSQRGEMVGERPKKEGRASPDNVAFPRLEKLACYNRTLPPSPHWYSVA
jgi:hypothetical protein